LAASRLLRALLLAAPPTDEPQRLRATPDGYPVGYCWDGYWKPIAPVYGPGNEQRAG
jgi:hypothetical protein